MTDALCIFVVCRHHIIPSSALLLAFIALIKHPSTHRHFFFVSVCRSFRSPCVNHQHVLRPTCADANCWLRCSGNFLLGLQHVWCTGKRESLCFSFLPNSMATQQHLISFAFGMLTFLFVLSFFSYALLFILWQGLFNVHGYVYGLPVKVYRFQVRNSK